jgi:hypothetical protein
MAMRAGLNKTSPLLTFVLQPYRLRQGALIVMGTEAICAEYGKIFQANRRLRFRCEADTGLARLARAIGRGDIGPIEGR